jgi:plasmid segregation protein ParM
MEIIGIDVGFGFTKAYNGRNSSIREHTLDQEKLLENFVKILAITAAGICTDTTEPINVVSGLPVGYLKRDSKKLKEMITGIHDITFHNTDGRDVTKRIHIDQIHVIPQPIGSIFNLIFDDQGKIMDKGLATQKLGVVDIGYKTTDFSIFDHLQYIERGSSTMDTGISKCFSIIAGKLRQESNITIELYRMFKFIESGIIKIRGKEYNISNLKKRVYTHAASAIASDLNRLWENDWDIDSIILSGGGSVELAEFLTPHIQGNVIPIGKHMDARFNNVHGYCKFGRYKWGYAKFMADQHESPPKNENLPASGLSDPAAVETEDSKIDKSSKGLSWLRRQG